MSRRQLDNQQIYSEINDGANEITNIQDAIMATTGTSEYLCRKMNYYDNFVTNLF